MTTHPYLQGLLKGEKTEWIALGEITEIKRGTSITKRNIVEGDIPVIAGGRTPAYYHSESNRSGQTITIAGSGVYAGFVGWWEKPIFVSDAFSIKPKKENLSARYCYYFLSNIQQQLHDMKKGGGVPHVYPRDIAPIKIPIPCPDKPERSLEIQAAIVDILDKMTALNAELNAEHSMRIKQYQYVREKLLTFPDDIVEWKPLGKISSYAKSRISFQEVSENNYIGVDNILPNKKGKVKSNYKPLSGSLIKYQKNDILIGNIRPYLKKIWHADCIGGTNGDVLVIRLNDSTINVRYLYQVLADDKFFAYNMRHAKGAKMPRGDKMKIMEYLIPIPYPDNPEKSLAEQARIAAILDKFETLAHSLTEGLPREIALREKQYAYYRGMLFSFPAQTDAAQS